MVEFAFDCVLGQSISYESTKRDEERNQVKGDVPPALPHTTMSNKDLVTEIRTIHDIQPRSIYKSVLSRLLNSRTPL